MDGFGSVVPVIRPEHPEGLSAVIFPLMDGVGFHGFRVYQLWDRQSKDHLSQ